MKGGFLQLLLLLAVKSAAQQPSSADDSARPTVLAGACGRGVDSDVESVDSGASPQKRAGDQDPGVVCPRRGEDGGGGDGKGGWKESWIRPPEAHWFRKPAQQPTALLPTWDSTLSSVAFVLMSRRPPLAFLHTLVRDEDKWVAVEAYGSPHKYSLANELWDPGVPPSFPIEPLFEMPKVTTAQQQHFISPGGQPKIAEQPKNTLVLPTTAQQAKPGPAAYAQMNLAAVLRSAGSHFARHAPSSGMASGVAPTHALVGGIASQDPRIASGATEAPISSLAAALSPEARRQRLVMLRGEVAALKSRG